MVCRVRGAESTGEGLRFVQGAVQEIFAIEIDRRAGAAHVTRPGHTSTHPCDVIELQSSRAEAPELSFWPKFTLEACFSPARMSSATSKCKCIAIRTKWN